VDERHDPTELHFLCLYLLVELSAYRTGVKESVEEMIGMSFRFDVRHENEHFLIFVLTYRKRPLVNLRCNTQELSDLFEIKSKEARTFHFIDTRC
jgi:hypothetical protein